MQQTDIDKMNELNKVLKPEDKIRYENEEFIFKCKWCKNEVRFKAPTMMFNCPRCGQMNINSGITKTTGILRGVGFSVFLIFTVILIVPVAFLFGFGFWYIAIGIIVVWCLFVRHYYRKWTKGIPH
jgi:predicted RNA-binding Zn-ribbon protein involved in translation (DUF1610 family)